LTAKITLVRGDTETSQPSARGDLLVIEPIGDFTCAHCGGTDDFLKMEDAGPLCLTCADLDTLVFLAAGDAALDPASAGLIGQR
jgi:hypothetical protein